MSDPRFPILDSAGEPKPVCGPGQTEMCKRCVKNLEHLEYLDHLRNDVDHRIADKVVAMSIPSEVLDDEMRDLIKLKFGQRNGRTVEEGGRTFDMSDLKCGEARDGGPRRNPARRHPTKKSLGTETGCDTVCVERTEMWG